MSSLQHYYRIAATHTVRTQQPRCLTTETLHTHSKHADTQTNTHTHAHALIHTETQTYARTHTHICIYIYIYRHIHIYLYTHRHKHASIWHLIYLKNSSARIHKQINNQTKYYAHVCIYINVQLINQT